MNNFACVIELCDILSQSVSTIITTTTTTP